MFRFVIFFVFTGLLFFSCKRDYIICKTCGCGDVDKAQGDLTVDSLKFYIPTIFTPNGDGLNDFFRPVYETRKVKNATLEIFSRDRKRKLFSTSDPAILWDGKDSEGRECGQRIFAWEFRGTTSWDRNFIIKGEIFLLREDCYSGSDQNKCTFADQIVPMQGFVSPTAEKYCD